MLSSVDVDELRHALGGVVLEAAYLERTLRTAFSALVGSKYAAVVDGRLTAAALLEDLRNPAAAKPLDPSTARGRGRGVAPRRALVPALAVAAIVGLISLMWLSRPPAPAARAPTLREK